MKIHQKNKFIFFYIAIFFFFGLSVLLDTGSAFAISIRGHGQGATITEQYFIYTDHRNDNATSILRCNRSGASTSNCKTIVKTRDLGHANALDHVWGSNYFAVYDGWCNPRTSSSCVVGCYTLDGKSVSKSKCNQRANNKYQKSSVPQGYAQYKVGKTTYFLKGFSGPNKIQIYKNGKLQKTLTGLKSGELEDVMVDGKTGKVYYTVSGWGSVKLYGTNYKLPKSSGESSQEIKKYKGSHISPANPKKIKAKNSSANTESQYDGSVDTIFFGKVEGDDKGCDVSKVLVFIIEILTYGIGITAVIGISVFGIMYLTAGGNAAKTTKAKKRILEIVVGLALYAVLWALLNFLLPGGKLNSIDQCGKADQSSSEQYIA